LVPLLRLRHADVEIVEAVIEPDSPLVGKPLRDVRLPRDAAISLIIRGHEPVFPHADIRFQAGDEVIAMTLSVYEDDLRRVFFSNDGT
jgi:trk system potassium uptake protein TrkA